ncbi:MAG: phosphatidylserine decarboxylase family protein [Syntrophales bacterium]
MHSRNELIIREGYKIIIPFALSVIIFAVLGMLWTAIFFFFVTSFNIWFFRNPERTIPQDTQAVVSPADGKVLKIEEVQEDSLIKGRFRKISVFMNVFNVHVNRIPFPGKVDAVRYHKGKFLVASLDKASSMNEKNSILLKTDRGREILLIQIAGVVARRIICWVHEGMAVERGQRFGLICYGSRLEIFLPLDSNILTKVGDKVKAGETIIGYLT